MKIDTYLLIMVVVLAINTGCRSVLEKPPQQNVMITVEDNSVIKQIDKVELNFNKEIGESSAKQKFLLGGFSGLYFSSAKSNEPDLTLWSVTDRGPNGGEISSLIGVGRNARPFLLPKFNPLLVKMELDLRSFSVKLSSTVELKNSNGKNMSGLPYLAQTKKNRNYIESSVDNFGNKVNADPNGVDSEGLCIDNKGHFWVVEEYGPDILKFDAKARLVKRFKPGKELPSFLLKRKMNRGFEGVACAGNKLYAILQSPIKSENSKNTVAVPLLEFDLTKEKLSALFVYVLEDEKADKIGDLSLLPNGQLLVLEQNGKTGKESKRKVFKASLDKAKNILNILEPEGLSMEDLKSFASVQKELVVDLSSTELNQSEKIEGLAAVNASTLLLISDNDFSLVGDVDLQTGLAVTDPNKKSYLYRVQLKSSLLY